MAKTPQGMETKRQLLQSSGELFYKYGYTKTKMQAIADSAGITIGSIGYYFKKKEDIAGELLKRYISKLYRYIIRNSETPLDAFTLHTTASLPYYKNLYMNKRVNRFYYELLVSGSQHSSVSSQSSFRKMMDNVNDRIMKENGVEQDEFQKIAVTIFNSGGRNALVIKLMEDYFTHETIDDAINYIGIGTGTMLGVPQEKIMKAVDYCNEFNAMHHDDLKKIYVLET